MTYKVYTRDWTGKFKFSRSFHGVTVIYGQYFVGILDEKDVFTFIGSNFWSRVVPRL